MAALSGPKEEQRQPSDLVPYTGNSGYNYYAGALLMRGATAGLIVPIASTTGASGLLSTSFIGVAANSAFPSNGSSNSIIDVWKTGEFTVDAQGTGVSADIGKIGYAFNDNTVGTSFATPRLAVGEIVGVPTSTTYRLRITNQVGRVAD